MTKLRIISDLHREYSDWNYTPQGEDIILIAGDVFSGNRYGILEKLAAQTYPTPTYLVAGNHEFYDKDVKEQWEAIRAFERKHPHMKWLENEFVDFPTFRLWGATLWTDFALNGEYDQKRAMDLARNEIGDFSSILDRGSMLHPRTLLHWNFESRYLLEEQVKESPLPLVVMTHFCPSRRTIDPAYEGQLINAYFTCSMDSFFGPKIPLWVHGHSHTLFDQVLDGTRVIRNPKGYTKEALTWNENLIIESP